MNRIEEKYKKIKSSFNNALSETSFFDATVPSKGTVWFLAIISNEKIARKFTRHLTTEKQR
jgi:hypothetical protein